MTRATAIEVRELVGGLLCLDYVNTVSWRGRAEPEERIESYEALLEWAVVAGALTSRRASVLRGRARREPEAAEAALEAARELREVLYRMIVAWSAGRSPRKDDLARFNLFLDSAPERRRLRGSRSGYSWETEERGVSLVEPVVRVVWSAAELLTSGDPGRVRVCDGEGCGWLFHDASRTGTRRWCSMGDCGNRAKARRHYARSTRRRKSAGKKARRPRSG